MTRRWILLVTFGLLGYAALFALFPRLSPLANWGFRLDRAQAVAAARQTAVRFDQDAATWRAGVETERDREIEYYLARHPHPIARAVLTPVTVNVSFRDAGHTPRLRVELAPSGRAVRIERLDGEEDDDQKEAPPAAPEDPDKARTIAESAVKELLGAEHSLFAPVAESETSHTGRTFKWTATLPGEQRLTLTAEARVKAGVVREVAVTHTFAPAFRNEQRALSRGFSLNPGGVFLILTLIAAFISYILAAVRREIPHRSTLIFFGAMWLVLIVLNTASGWDEELTGSFNNRPMHVYGLVAWLGLVLVMFIFALPLYLFQAAGQSLSGRLPQRRTVAWELFWQGKFRLRYVAEAIAAGLLGGGVIAALPYALKTVWPRELFFSGPGLEDLLIAPVPGVAVVASGYVFALLMLFAFVVPFIEFYARRTRLAWVFVLLGGAVLLGDDDHFYHSALGIYAAGLATMIVFYALYRGFDLLAVMTAGVASRVALGAATMFAQPSASLRGSAVNAMAALGGLLLLAFVGVRRRRALPAGIFEPLYTSARRAERERLKAEFEVAGRAQQQMLPDAPPSLPGYDIAAVCQPSKDVGGDLYDFLPLPDGKLGIVVADVSGKGVPAALYMTLTKGLLASVAEEQSDPGEILREVNRHLYDACRKKMFVTLFLGVLEPATRTLTYARAGHNPTVWRSPSRQATELLRAPGLGLGLNQGKIFDRTLKVESLRLDPGDALYFYSDGITEAMNREREEYGEERLMTMAAQSDGLSAAAARDAVMANVKAFLGSIAPQDDQTLVVVRVTNGK